MDLRQMGWGGGMVWIDLVQDRDRHVCMYVSTYVWATAWPVSV
jgi:hypothetical protein